MTARSKFRDVPSMTEMKTRAKRRRGQKPDLKEQMQGLRRDVREMTAALEAVLVLLDVGTVDDLRRHQ